MIIYFKDIFKKYPKNLECFNSLSGTPVKFEFLLLLFDLDQSSRWE